MEMFHIFLVRNVVQNANCVVLCVTVDKGVNSLVNFTFYSMILHVCCILLAAIEANARILISFLSSVSF